METDLERLSKARGVSHVAAEHGNPTGVSSEAPLLALCLSFQLPSSCYATMLIRELTKQSTDKEFQSALSLAAGKNDGGISEGEAACLAAGPITAVA